ncbi:GGDEF domain-containing protein [Acinetobacter sp. ANC 4633]|uniref:sensor domain-containing diguanylate cyclase n=1 Tax=Acinetobacter sp. ANC 4633 TaxID=2529845 RepID=UPI00103C9EDD|nr:sensor domain-containing diguanylate cyclase [Acinetobacter sp. ANC 4633]TCB25377.1 GGDEF domain-containing protein [Acinetobacter sp. ANC 4633]
MTFKKFIYSLDLNLRKLILYLSIFSVVSLFIVSLIVSYYIEKHELLHNALSVNAEYAAKIANSSDSHFKMMQKELAYSAEILGKNFNNQKYMQNEVERLKYQSNYFNSVTISDQDGKFLSFAPLKLNFQKNKVNRSLGFKLSLEKKAPVISSPYYGTSKNLLIFISHPIFDEKRHYLGFIGATIYLKHDNILNKMLSGHYGYRHNYMYVVDKNQYILFHPDVNKIGQLSNINVQNLAIKNRGEIRLKDEHWHEWLAGFARIPTTGWMVISQQPASELLKETSNTVYEMLVGMLLFYILIFFVIWQISYLISSPLSLLANMASNLHQPDIDANIERINPWFVEVLKFKNSLLISSKHFKETISELKLYIHTDPLTHLYNRRGMGLSVAHFIEKSIPFAVISIDIDYFKKINDAFGHDQGDLVLKEIAGYIRSNFRDEDICCRSGGEEFVVLAARLKLENAVKLAEHLRKKIESTSMPLVGKVTISIGISHWSATSQNIKTVFKRADECLYNAKADGRNCTRF